MNRPAAAPRNGHRSPRPARGGASMAIIGVLAIALGGCTASTSTPSTALAPEPPLLPRPAALQRLPGDFVLPVDRPLRLVADDADGADVAALLVERVARSCGRRLQLIDQAAAGEQGEQGEQALIRLQRLPPPADAPATDPATERERYRLQIRPDGIVLAAAAVDGLRHGASTLLQLLCMADATALPALDIDDAPQFDWRGLMLDSARHYQSPAFIRALLEAMALHKLNVLHWHLTDDQAWRLQIRAWPKLTEIGAWRVPAGAAEHDIDPASGAPRRIGGYYSQDVVRELVAHAGRLGITIVPEIEMPGHASAALVAYPQFAASDDPPTAVPADWGIYPNAFALDEPTFAFLESVLVEVMELFPSHYIHVGGDEVEPGQWLASEMGQARLRELRSEDPAALQHYFTTRIARFLDRHGRRLVGWDEILPADPARDRLPPGAVVMSWRGIDGALTAAAHGHDTVLAAWPTLYFDNRQAGDPGQPPGRGRIVSLQDVYAFDALPAALDGAARRHLLGLQGNVWTEHIRNQQRVGYMSFPRAAAVAELGWTPAARRSWPDFAARVPSLFPFYAALGITHAGVTVAEPAAPPAAGRVRASQQLRLCSEQIALSLEDDAPFDGPRAVFLVDIQNPCWIWPAAELDGITAIRARVGQLPFNFQIGDAIEKIRFAEPQSADGELEVRLGDCDGERLARLPLAPAVASSAVTELPPAMISPRRGRHDLCLRFAQPPFDLGLEPGRNRFWVLDRIELVAP
jgi:hexosaminidase